MGDPVDSPSADEDLNDGIAALREDLIAPAVRFLTNPDLADRPDSVKQSFLLKKGLTEAEIDEAKKRAAAVVPHQQQQQQQQQNQVTVWSRLNGLAGAAFLLWVVAKGVRFLWEEYISSWLFGKTSRRRRLSLELQQGIHSTVETLAENVLKLQEKVESQNETLSELRNSVNSTQNRSDVQESKHSSQLAEIKKDVQSLKGLFLSSDRFPSHPVSKIPSWQLESKTDDKKPSLQQNGEMNGNEETSHNVNGHNGETQEYSPDIVQ